MPAGRCTALQQTSPASLVLILSVVGFNLSLFPQMNSNISLLSLPWPLQSDRDTPEHQERQRKVMNLHMRGCALVGCFFIGTSLTLFFLPHSPLFKGRHVYPLIAGFVDMVMLLLFWDSSLIIDPSQGLLRLLDRG